MTTYRIALYDTEGLIVKSYVGEPLWQEPTAQNVADMVARSAEQGCSYPEGVVAVWTDPDLVAPLRLENGPAPAAQRAYGGAEPPVPTYRWGHTDDWGCSITAVS